jgi:hypothetical protein
MQNPEILFGKGILDTYELPIYEMPYQPPVLPVDLYLQIEKEKYRIHKQSSIELSPMNVSFSVEMENIHNKAIFDGLNEALDCMRPYGLRGPPVPWSKSNRTLTFKYGSLESLDDVLRDARKRVLNWSNYEVGTLCDKKASDEVKKKIDRIREERLQSLLRTEIEDTDRLWLDFEMEET